MVIEVGKPAPDFTLPDQDGRTVSLKQFRGADLIVYFYPEDETPGCTNEACAFRDLFDRILAEGAEIVGISPDDGAAHRAFRENHQLPFLLLSDPDLRVMRRYGAYGEKTLYGRKVEGVIRSTVWVSADGKVVQHWKRVGRAADHPAKVLEALRARSSRG